MPTLRECCPPGYQFLNFNFPPPTCYYRRKDFDERLLVGLGRWVDPSKPPVAADCSGQSASSSSSSAPSTPAVFRRKAPSRRRLMSRPVRERGRGTILQRPRMPTFISAPWGPGPRPFSWTDPSLRPTGGGSEPPGSGQSVPGILDRDLFGTGVTGQDIIDVGGAVLDWFGGRGGGGGGGGGQTIPTKELVPTGGTGDECPGFSVHVPGIGCVNLGDLGPGGPPAVTGTVSGGVNGKFEGFGPPTKGMYGVGITPRVEARTVRRCPEGFALGDDGVCYDNLHRNSPRRMWPMGQKPLLTPGDRAAIRKAKAAATKLSRSKKSLKKAARALEKVC